MNKLSIKYSPKFVPGTGLVGKLSWNNADVKEALRDMFGVRVDESIIGLEVSEAGITAYFERI